MSFAPTRLHPSRAKLMVLQHEIENLHVWFSALPVVAPHDQIIKPMLGHMAVLTAIVQEMAIDMYPVELPPIEDEKG